MEEMRRSIRLLLLVLTVCSFSALAPVVAAGAQPDSSGYPDPPHGPVVDVGAAPVIVIGKTLSTQAVWSQADQVVYTLTTFQVDHAQRGNPPPTIVVKTLGGTANGLTQV